MKNVEFEQVKLMLREVLEANTKLKNEIEEKDNKIEFLECEIENLRAEIDDLHYSISYGSD